MQGKRTYSVLRKFLLQACEEIETKGLRLSERVFIPEQFVLDHAIEITKRHREALSLLLTSDARRQFKMMIAIGELKDFKATALGYQLVLKHLPDCPFLLEQRAGERTKRAFDSELIAWSARHVRLVVAALIHARHERCYQVNSLTIMMTSRQWIPLDHVYETDVVEKLITEQRTFIKPLGYDTGHAGTFPNFQLLDSAVRPIAPDILSPFESANERAAKQQAIDRRPYQGWVWNTASVSLVPELPPISADSC